VSCRSLPLDGLLEAFSDAGPDPGGGSAAVITVALSAALCVMAARLSTQHMPEATDIAAEASRLRDDLAPLCDADSEAYLRVIAESRRADDDDPAARKRRVTAALSDASDVPMAVVAAGARLAHLAGRLAEEGNPNLRGDAMAAAVLAGAGAEAAGGLVRINLAELPEDDRHVLVSDFLADVTAWVERARRAVGSPTG
jgi:formiminotetrahydrofolate cyclodeaminase